MRRNTVKDYKIKLTQPQKSQIEGVVALPKIIHFDKRGFLVETLRADDKEVGGKNFVMTYTSATPAGVARDVDKWHYHATQVDRFIVPLGEIALALFDNRKKSKTFRLCQVLHLKGATLPDFEKAQKENLKFEIKTYLVTIPVGIYHCYKNISQNLVILQNFPTKLYDPNDEGREPFENVPIANLGNKTFSWELIEK